VRQAVLRAGWDSTLARTPDDVMAAERIILPGVGAAGTALETLRHAGLDQALTERVRKQAVPMLGICLGMQMLAERLYEFGEHKGLGWIPGAVVALRDIAGPGIRVPHMGWNEIKVRGLAEDLFWDVRGKRQFYFAHSFTLRPGGDESAVAAVADYGVSLVAAVQSETVFATQFHPEKSQINGDRLIGAFLDWMP
jgi:glutamine amidotransferase